MLSVDFIHRTPFLIACLGLLVCCSLPNKPDSLVPPDSADHQEAIITTPSPARVVPRPPALAGPGLSSHPTTIESPTDADSRSHVSGLQQELDDFVGGLNGAYGVAAYSYSTGESVGINESEFFPAGSLYKLVVLYEAYRQAEVGEVDLTTTLEILPQHLVESDDTDLSLGERLSIGEALRSMTSLSSNAAAYAVLYEIGWQRFNEAAYEFGLTETTIPIAANAELQPEWRQVVASTSPRDMLHFFDLLARRQLVSPSASEAMLALLLDQEVNDRIPAGLPDNVLIAHKTGELYRVRNDAGVIFTETNTYILVVLSAIADDDEEVAAIVEIARLVHARFG